MKTLVAIYPTRAQAEEMKARLIDHGISQERLALSPESRGDEAPLRAEQRPSGFWDWLFGSDVDDEARDSYSSALSGGRTALSVYLTDDARRAEIESLLHAHGALDLSMDPSLSGRSAGVDPANPRQSGTTATTEQRIPIVKEELEVGKRQTEQRYHVRVHPVSREVAEEIRLRDERVVIERRPTGGYAPTEADMAPREFEVVERHEEPVVAKTARATEEVVVSRDAQERVETVRDTVRETKVDVEKSQTRGKRA